MRQNVLKYGGSAIEPGVGGIFEVPWTEGLPLKVDIHLTKLFHLSLESPDIGAGEPGGVVDSERGLLDRPTGFSRSS